MKNKKKQALISVFEEVNSFMELNLEKWNGIDAIRRTYDELVKNLKKIKELQPEINKDIEGLKEDLAGKRIQLLDKIFPLANILEVYAQDYPLGKNSYALLMDWKHVESLSERDLLDHALSLHKRCDKLLRQTGGSDENLDRISPMSNINRYGLTNLMLDELYTSTQQFQSTLKLRKDVDIYRKKTRKKLEGLIRANRELLKRRLDKLMTVFSGTHPSFYKEYRKVSSKN